MCGTPAGTAEFMEDIESHQIVGETPIGLRFVISACIAQFLAPPVGTIVFDLAFSPTTDDSLATYFTGIMRLIPYSWMLAVEPLTIAVVLAMCSSAIQTRRNWITMIVVVTLLNALASTMCIIGRSL